MNRKIIVVVVCIFFFITNPIIESNPLKKEQNLENNHVSNKMISYRWNARDIKIIMNEKIENLEDYNINVSVYLPIPMNLSAQIIRYPIKYNIKPDEYVIDSWDQKVACYYRNLKPGENITIQWGINATIYTIRHIIFPWLVKGEIPKEIIDKYTSDETKYQIHHPIIQNIVEEQTNGIENPLIKSILLCNYVCNHLSYVLDDQWDDAPTVLERGNGSCSEYCFVYISLLRAAGIPARYMGGTVFKSNETPYIDNVFHRIVEIYLPNYGWIPVDPTWGDYSKIPFFYFGSYQNKIFIVSIGGGPSEFLDWNYCHWEGWSPDSQNVYVNLSFTWGIWNRKNINN